MNALIAAKLTGALSGPICPTLVAMLDRIGETHWLRFRSADELFGAASHLLQTTSVLETPVFLSDGRNYIGTPNMTRTGVLKEQLMSGFAKAIETLGDTYYLPLRPKVSEPMLFLSSNGRLDSTRILHGMPRSSPANMERINYFLGKKPCDELSEKCWLAGRSTGELDPKGRVNRSSVNPLRSTT